MLNILENSKFVELKRMKEKNRELVKVFKTGNLDYHILMMEGLESTGLDECGGDRLFKYENMGELKEINWRRMADDLDFVDNMRKRFDTVMSSFEDYLPFDLMFKKEINKTILNPMGEDLVVKNLVMRNALFIIEEKYNLSLMSYHLNLEGQTSFDDLFLVKQLYDELLDVSCGFEELAKDTIKHNAVISSKLDEDISSFMLAEMI